jgi:hypothetical protein
MKYSAHGTKEHSLRKGVTVSAWITAARYLVVLDGSFLGDCCGTL